MNNLEQTLSIIKPDAVERNLQDQIKNEFKNNGFEDGALDQFSESARDLLKKMLV